MTRHDDRSRANRDLANGLLADLGGAPLPEEGVRETHGHNAASFAVEAHRPPAAHHMGTQPNAVVVSQTDPVWPPKAAPTLASAGNELVSSTELDRSMPPSSGVPSSRDAVTVQRAPVSVRGGVETLPELPSPSPPLVVRGPMVGRTTAPSIRVKSSVSKAIIGGFAVGGVLVAAMGLWFVLTKDPAPAAAPASTVVVSVMRPPAAAVTEEAPASTPVVTTPVAPAPPPPAAVVAKPKSESHAATPPAAAPPAPVPAPKPTSKSPPTSGPIEEPDRTF